MPIITPGATTVGAVTISGLAPGGTPIESWPNAMLTGRGYGMSLGQAPTAGVHSVIELRNPAGSGKNIWVYELTWQLSLIDNMIVFVNTPPSLTGGYHGANLLTTLLNSVGMLANTTVATIGVNNIWGVYSQPNVLTWFPYPWIVVIPPNNSLYMTTGVVNNLLNVNVMWAEY